MKKSPMPENQLRYKIGRIGTAIAFALVVGSFAVGSASAADRGHDAHGGGGRPAARDDRGGHGHDDHRGRPDNNYYAPPANYYTAPEPYYYDSPEPAPAGVNLFFGL
jgi:hypothetical protein